MCPVFYHINHLNYYYWNFTVVCEIMNFLIVSRRRRRYQTMKSSITDLVFGGRQRDSHNQKKGATIKLRVLLIIIVSWPFISNHDITQKSFRSHHQQILPSYYNYITKHARIKDALHSTTIDDINTLTLPKDHLDRGFRERARRIRNWSK